MNLSTLGMLSMLLAPSFAKDTPHHLRKGCILNPPISSEPTPFEKDYLNETELGNKLFELEEFLDTELAKGKGEGKTKTTIFQICISGCDQKIEKAEIYDPDVSQYLCNLEDGCEDIIKKEPYLDETELDNKLFELKEFLDTEQTKGKGKGKSKTTIVQFCIKDCDQKIELLEIDPNISNIWCSLTDGCGEIERTEWLNGDGFFRRVLLSLL